MGERLREILRAMGSAVVAYSGGVDSAVLAKVAHEELGERMTAVIGRSHSLPGRELREALAVADGAGFPVIVVDTQELADERYASNPANRCYFCKGELFAHLERVRVSNGFDWIAYGENLDDVSDFRPGARVAAERGVRAPLREAGLTKAEVRALAQELGLPVWEKPAFACLASRFPSGTLITAERLAQVEAAEDRLWELGFRQFRVRYHGDVARVEVERAEMVRLLEHADRVVAGIQAAGFRHVAMDLQGYRRGSTAVIAAELEVL